MREYKELKLGKHTVDVTKISHGRVEIARNMWDKVFTTTKGKTKSRKHYNNKANKIGSYLLNERFKKLRQRLSFFDALKEWYKRRFIITARYINWCSNEEYEEFQNWLSVTITGFDLKELEKKNDLETLAMHMILETEKAGISLGQLMDASETFVKQLAGNVNTLESSQRKK